MYSGYWQLDKSYKKGDIIYIVTLSEYYICINDHISDRLTFPNKEDIYWMYISNSFLKFLQKYDFNTPESTLNQKKNEYNVITKKEEINECDKKGFKIIKPKAARYKTTSQNSSQDSSHNSLYNVENNKLKRKLQLIEDEITNYKRQKNNEDELMSSLKNKLLCMD